MTNDPRAIRNLAAFLLLVALPVVAYIPAMQGGFIWDDDAHVSENQTLREPDALYRIWLVPGEVPQYYPLTHTVFWLEYQAFGLNPLGYKIVNVLLHALSALLVWHILRRLQFTPAAAYIAACIFAVHPVHVESVAWITELKNTLSGAFYLAAMAAYLQFTGNDRYRERRYGWYALAFVLFIAALWSKTVTATLPVVLLLLLWWKRGRITWRDVWPTTPLFAAGLLLGLITVWMEKHFVGAGGQDFNFTLIDRCLIAGRAVWFYACKLVWPHPLIFTYPRWDIDAGAGWQYLFPLAAVATVIALWLLRKRIGRGPLVAALCFGVTLFPAIGFFDVYPFTFSFVADHFQYLASLALIALAAAGLARWDKGRAAATLIIVVFAVLTWRQGYIYKDLETVWRDTLAKNPSSWMAHNNIVSLLVADDKLDEALEHALKSIELNDINYKAYNNAANVYRLLGRPDKAVDYFWLAIQVAPEHPRAYVGTGELLAEQGRIDEAMDWWDKALVFAPLDKGALLAKGRTLMTMGRAGEARELFDLAVQAHADSSSLHYQLGEIYMAHHDYDRAAEHFRRAVRIEPALAEGHQNLGAAVLAQGYAARALSHFQDALALNPNLVGVRSNLALALAQLGRVDEAVEQFQAALAANPDDVEGRLQYANLLAQLERTDAAIDQFEALLRRDPDNADGHNNLAVLLSSRNRVLEAADHFREAIRINPDYPDAHNNLGVMLENLGRIAEATEQYRQAVALMPNYVDAQFNLGLALLQQGQATEAVQWFARVVTLQPGHVSAHYRLGLALQLTGDDAKAAEHYRLALRLEADQVDVMVRLAWILATDNDPAQRDAGEAIELATRAVTLTQRNAPTPLDALAAGYALAGQFDKAVATAKAALALVDANSDMAARIEYRLRLYELEQPYIQGISVP